MRTGQGRLFFGMVVAALLMIAASATDVLAQCTSPTAPPSASCNPGDIMVVNPGTTTLICVRPPVWMTVRCGGVGASCTDASCLWKPANYTLVSCWVSPDGSAAYSSLLRVNPP